MCCMCMHKLSFCPAKIAFFAIYHKQMAENCSLLLFFLFSSLYLKKKCGIVRNLIEQQIPTCKENRWGWKRIRRDVKKIQKGSWDGTTGRMRPFLSKVMRSMHTSR